MSRPARLATAAYLVALFIVLLGFGVYLTRDLEPKQLASTLGAEMLGCWTAGGVCLVGAYFVAKREEAPQK